MSDNRTIDPVFRDRGNARLPPYMLKQYRGRSRNFFRSHRIALRRAIYALGECRRGSAYSGDSEAIDAAERLIERCLEHCRGK